jgi:hypothetical protein
VLIRDLFVIVNADFAERFVAYRVSQKARPLYGRHGTPLAQSA